MIRISTPTNHNKFRKLTDLNRIICPKKTPSCEWCYWTVKNLEHHKKKCHYRMVKCEICSQFQNYYTYQLFHGRNCLGTKSRCTFCSVKFRNTIMISHLCECPTLNGILIQKYNTNIEPNVTKEMEDILYDMRKLVAHNGLWSPDTSQNVLETIRKQSTSFMQRVIYFTKQFRFARLPVNWWWYSSTLVEVFPWHMLRDLKSILGKNLSQSILMGFVGSQKCDTYTLSTRTEWQDFTITTIVVDDIRFEFYAKKKARRLINQTVALLNNFLVTNVSKLTTKYLLDYTQE